MAKIHMHYAKKNQCKHQITIRKKSASLSANCLLRLKVQIQSTPACQRYEINLLRKEYSSYPGLRLLGQVLHRCASGQKHFLLKTEHNYR